jgi:hypothetical protein
VVAWEVDSRRKHTCPCGASTYTLVFLSNDWGSSREEWTMDCSACRETHQIEEFTYREGDKQYVGRHWVRRQEK